MAERDEEGSGPSSVRLQGIGAAPGVVNGPILRLGRRRSECARRVSGKARRGEIERFEQAVRETVDELRQASARSRDGGSSAAQAVLEAYALMAADPMLQDAVIAQIRDHGCRAEWAIESAARELSSQLGRAKDVYLRERSLDVEFVGELLQRRLLGITDDWSDGHTSHLPVLIAEDLSPARAALLRPGQVGALVTERGSRTSHLAVIANAMGVPCVVACPGALRASIDHAVASVDGDQGEVVFSRSPSAPRARQRPSPVVPRLPLTTRCGVPFELLVSVHSAEEVVKARAEGISGVGLYRSEFLLARHGNAPSEQEQYRAYREVVEAAAPYPVTLRTFDVDGEKFADASGAPPSSNPALGMRGIRWALARPQQLEVQLRAMLRAAQHGDVRILVPMVTTVDEMRTVRECVERVSRGLDTHRRVPLGCMVETPAAALRSEHFAREVQLLSVGSNDLLQYTLAADRADPALHALCSPFDPAALLLVKQVTEAAQAASVPLSVCGIMAADPLAAALLLGLGVRAFSVEYGALARVRQTLQSLELAPLVELAARSVRLPSAQSVEAELRRTLRPRLPIA